MQFLLNYWKVLTSIVGFVAAVLGIYQFSEGQMVATPHQPTPVPAAFPADSDEQRLQNLLTEFATCQVVAFRVDHLDRRDTKAEDSASGQPGVYLEARVAAQVGEVREPIVLVGNGRGPAAESAAFDGLLGAANTKTSQIFNECQE